MSDRLDFSVAICDDEEEWCIAISDSCRRYMEDKDVNIVFHSFNNGENLISVKDLEIDVLFLDVEMENMDGLEVMKAVEGMPNIHNIIFVSSHIEAVWESFGSKTKGFIPKPFKDEDIWNKIKDIYIKKATDGVLKFSDYSGVVYFNKSDIIYLKADSNYVTIHARNSEKIITITLKECESIIGGFPFVRIHKSYIVNLAHVSNMSGSVLILKNGEKCNIGRVYRNQVKNSYDDYLRKELHV